MNGLPPEIDLSELSKADLLQLRFGLHQLQLIFGDRISVAVESACELRRASKAPTRIENYTAAASDLCQLLGTRLIDAQRTAEGGLVLRFTNEVELTVLLDGGSMESFQVHIGDRTIVA